MRLLKSKRILLILVLAGLAIVIIAKALRSAPEHVDLRHQPRPAEYIDVGIQHIKPRVKGYGYVQPAVLIDKQAEVSGRVEYVHPQLVSGSLLEKGTLVVGIDDTDYQLAYRQATANVVASRAQLVELDENQTSLKQTAKLIEQKLRLSKNELERKLMLRKNNSISQSSVDTEQVKYLQLQQEQTSIQQQLATLPSQRNVLLAELDANQAQVKQQQRNIDRTQVRMPVTGRIIHSTIDAGQFASVGQVLYQLHGIDQVEIEAQFTVEQLAPFMELFVSKDTKGVSVNAGSITDFIHHAKLTANVYLPVVKGQSWSAQVVSIGGQLDPQSRTMGIVVRVNAPYDDVIPGKRPPLLDGMHVEVDIVGAAVDKVAVPNQAIQQHGLYVADGENRLRKLNPSPSLTMDNVTLFDEHELNGNPRIITTDLVPAIVGMPLTLTLDQSLQDRLTEYGISEGQE